MPSTPADTGSSPTITWSHGRLTMIWKMETPRSAANTQVIRCRFHVAEALVSASRPCSPKPASRSPCVPAGARVCTLSPPDTRSGLLLLLVFEALTAPESVENGSAWMKLSMTGTAWASRSAAFALSSSPAAHCAHQSHNVTVVSLCHERTRCQATRTVLDTRASRDFSGGLRTYTRNITPSSHQSI